MSTAKSMAAQYLNGKRGTKTLGPSRFKSSTSNLAPTSSNNSNSRLKSTSMTNLIATNPEGSSTSVGGGGARIQRPASRNALDSIHMGMNAKYAQVQSKVLLQNIRPQQAPATVAPQTSSRIPAGAARPLGAGAATPTGARKSPSKLAARGQQPQQPTSDKAQLLAKIKTLQEELERQEQAREELRLELEREKADKLEELQQVKVELQEKVAEHERQNEDYHQKLLEAYELADQNRRAADSVLSESRQRDEESRKRIEELEQQLGDLKEFVSMKEEMAGKMGELRDQLREERERYEEKTRNMHQMFENEKISVDQNSNYFRRAKPNLQSVESVNRLTEPSGQAEQHDQQQQRKSSKHLHRSEHDIYGSKLSTRMQDTARSAWVASRKLARSVITGGVGGLSACRQCTRRRSSGASISQRAASPSARFAESAAAAQLGLVASSCQFESSPASGHQRQGFEHTSVIEVGKPAAAGERIDLFQEQQRDKVVVSAQPTASGHLAPELARDELEGGGNSLRVAAAAAHIHVDGNNKLTIVTKFNDSDACATSSGQVSAGSQSTSNSSTGPAAAAASSSAASNSSERSRCESSSSGRGTASDAGSSSASQNGDLDVSAAAAAVDNAPCGETRQQQLGGESSPSTQCDQVRRHKRKSSLFKASKVFSGSQASLNKLRSFFAVASAKSSSAAASAAEAAEKKLDADEAAFGARPPQFDFDERHGGDACGANERQQRTAAEQQVAATRKSGHELADDVKQVCNVISRIANENTCAADCRQKQPNGFSDKEEEVEAAAAAESLVPKMQTASGGQIA